MAVVHRGGRVSQGGRVQRPGRAPEANEAPQLEDPGYVPRDSSESLSAAIRRFAGQPIRRKAEPGGESKGGDEEKDAEVSQPGEPAEKEADAVADDVADELHGGGDKKDKKKNGKDGGGDKAEEEAQTDNIAEAKESPGEAKAEGEEAGQQKAPKIGAKLSDGVVFRAAAGALPLQLHHYLTNKHSTYTPAFQKVIAKYGLTLDDSWNTEMLPHEGRHPTAYHVFVLGAVQRADAEAKGKKEKFLALIDQYVKSPVRANPKL